MSKQPMSKSNQPMPSKPPLAVPSKEEDIPDFVQTFATTILLGNSRLPELVFASLPLNPTVDVHRAVQELAEEFAEAEDEDEAPELQFRDFTTGDGELVKRTIAAQLREGATGRITLLSDPNYGRLAQTIYDYAVIPVRTSPLKGVTLSALVGVGGAGGSVSMLQIFHSGVTPTEATLSVAFVAGVVIVMGAANAVRRAVEAGLEQKLLRLMGIEGAQTVGEVRDSAAKTKRAKKLKMRADATTAAATPALTQVRALDRGTESGSAWAGKTT